MEETKLQRNNYFKIIGRLTKADVKLGTNTMTGQGYASVKATIQSVIKGEVFEYDVSFYTHQTTSEGKPSKLYMTYADMASIEGKKVEVSGGIRESRYFATKLDQMISRQELAGVFIRTVRDDEIDTANWELGGFVARTLTEKTNKKGEVYRYDLTLAQADK